VVVCVYHVRGNFASILIDANAKTIKTTRAQPDICSDVLQYGAAFDEDDDDDDDEGATHTYHICELIHTFHNESCGSVCFSALRTCQGVMTCLLYTELAWQRHTT